MKQICRAAGQGVALGRLGLIGSLLADGQLVTTEHGYRLIQRNGAHNPALAEVRDWIMTEAATTRAVMQGMNRKLC